MDVIYRNVFPNRGIFVLIYICACYYVFERDFKVHSTSCAHDMHCNNSNLLFTIK